MTKSTWSSFLYCCCIILLAPPVSPREHAYMDGDITIVGLFDVYDSLNGQCTEVLPSSVKNLEAVKWTLRKLNEENYVPGITLGFEAWPTCGYVPRANDRTIDLINRIQSDELDTTYQSPPVVGLIGPEHSSEAGNSSVLLGSMRATDKLVQIGYSTTATSLSNRNLYSNLYRVVPNDQLQIEVMISLLKQLEWNYIVVIYDRDIYGIEGYNALKARAAEENICIRSHFAVTIESNGAVSFSALRSFLEQTLAQSVSGVVVFSTASHINVLLNAAKKVSESNSDPISFLFSEGIELSEDSVRDSSGNVFDRSKGSFIVTPPRVIVDEFETYWRDTFKNVSILAEESLTNKWLRDIFAYYDENDCKPSNDSSKPGCSDLDQTEQEKLNKEYLYTSYAIKATYIMAKLIKDAHADKCPNQNGFCNSLKSTLYTNKGFLVDLIKDLMVDFETNFPFTPQSLRNFKSEFRQDSGILNITEYEVHHYRACVDDASSFCFEKIGKYRDDTLTLNTSLILDYQQNNVRQWPDINRAQCPNRVLCDSCIIKDLSEEVFYQPGDIIVGGIIPIHNRDSDNSMECGGIRTSLGVEIAESLAFGVSVINSKTDKYADFFPGQKVGYAFINSCNQPLVVQRKILELLKKGVKQADGTYIPVVQKLIGWIGAYGSSISTQSSYILSQLGFTQIAYASTAAVLSDRSDHPYFMRTCTPDDKQAKAMIKIIKELESDYIQVVYSEGTYGEGGRDAIRAQAQNGKVCIKKEILVREGENYHEILVELRKNSFARIVILFLRSHVVDDVTTALNDQMDEGEFIFIGSEAWGYRPDQFQNKKKLVGSITLALQMAENENFTSYLSNLDIYSNTNDPWIKSYAEKKFDCYFTTSFDKTGSQLCDRNLRLTDVQSYNQEIWTPFALNAMLALLAGANTAFKDLCGTSATKLCDEYQRHPEIVRNRTLQQTLDVFGDGNPIRVFDDNGDGNVGYRIYNIQRSREDVNVLIYAQVGQSPLDESNFRFNKNVFVKPDGISLPAKCPNQIECNKCFPEEQQTSITCTREEGDNTTATVLGVLIAILSIALIVALFMLVKMRCRNNQDPDDPYLDAVDPYLSTHQRNSGSYIMTTDPSKSNKDGSDDSGISENRTGT